MSDQARYPHVLRAVCETPWAIRPQKLAVIRDLLALRASGQRLTQEEIEARIGSKPAQKQSSTAGSVAIIPIYGVIQPKSDFFTEMSGGSTAQGLMDSLRAAAADTSIGAILLDVDSPGGQVSLIPETAAAIQAARESKPVVAIANTMAASAAYWLASQADELVITPSGEVGSIGVYAAHQDISGALEQEGIDVSLISAGKYKVETNPFEPLSDEAREAMQADVDAFYDMFVNAVAEGRRVSADAVRNGFGEGRMVLAKDAVSAGMADRIDTFEATVERLLADAASPPGFRSAAHSISAPTATDTWSGRINTTALPGAPPGNPAHPIDQAAFSGLSFAQAADASRSAPGRFVADATALRVLSSAKRGELVDCADSWEASAAAARELASQDGAAAPSEADDDFVVPVAFLDEIKRKVLQ